MSFMLIAAIKNNLLSVVVQSQFANIKFNSIAKTVFCGKKLMKNLRKKSFYIKSCFICGQQLFYPFFINQL
jgi:hypothetical protein